MNAQRPDMPESQWRSHESEDAPIGVAGAMHALTEAIAGKHVEPICAAYLVLRKAAGDTPVKDLIAQADAATEGKAQATIISAFSHRRCFMCNGGVSPCPSCAGTGRNRDMICSMCDGLGVEACSFCQGSGWNDRDQMPAEVRHAVIAKQVAHVEQDIRRLTQLADPKSKELARHLTGAQRAEIATWLCRLRGRLMALVNSDGNARATKFGAMARVVEMLLENLKPGLK
jgi:hypothetical protein